jgi:hypothetical protein
MSLKSIFLAGITLLVFSKAHSQTAFYLQEGDRLFYDVIANEQVYTFSVDIIKLDSTISFSWSMSPPINKSGYITISENALKNAKQYMNQFAGGTKDLDQESSVFMSDANFNELANTNTTKMDMGEGNSGEWFNNGSDNYGFIWKGSDVNPNAYYTKLEKSKSWDSRNIVVLAEGPFHLILRMNLGWSIQLKEVI